MPAIPAMAKYTVKAVAGDVKLKQGGHLVAAAPGMEIKAADLIVVGHDASLDILDSLDSKIYTTSTPGQSTVTRIVFDAKKAARSNSDAVNGNLRMGRSSQGQGIVYVEKGKVTRALSVYDPTAREVRVDVDKLANRVYAMMLDSLHGTAEAPSGIDIRYERTEGGGLRFLVGNNLTFPIYFNVFKITDGKTERVEISELGQPVGSYALQPAQIIVREQLSGCDPSESQVLIMTNYYFDIDELIARLNALTSAGDRPVAEADFPLYIKTF